MSIFKFKQFEVAQDRCEQKVGTDGVLLAAWAFKDKSIYKSLDIGAGTGVISLILAQRFNSSNIEAVELAPQAFEQCSENFEKSIWNDRLFCYHASFQEFSDEVDELYDSIISNPPFYQGAPRPDQKELNPERSQARFDEYLPFEDLLYGVYRLLDEDGSFATIIPYDREAELLSIARHYQLYPTRITHVKGNKESVIKRSLLEFEFMHPDTAKSFKPCTNELIIENSRHDYTSSYQELVKDFYLKM